MALEIRLIKNSKGLPCARCNGVHEFITRLSDDASCETPVAFSSVVARRHANLHAGGSEDVVRVPAKLAQLVVLDDSARQLPRTGSGSLRLAQFTLVTTSA